MYNQSARMNIKKVCKQLAMPLLLLNNLCSSPMARFKSAVASEKAPYCLLIIQWRLVVLLTISYEPVWRVKSIQIHILLGGWQKLPKAAKICVIRQYLAQKIRNQVKTYLILLIKSIFLSYYIFIDKILFIFIIINYPSYFI